MTRDDLRCRLAYPNVQAFLAVLRAALGTTGTAGYKIRADGAPFHGWRHPAQAVDQGNGRVSTGAGAYRIHHRTWEALALRFGFPDFSADAQDEAAVAMLDYSGALGFILSGHLQGALDRARADWPELPAKGQAGGRLTLARAIEIYEQSGGQFLPARAYTPPITHPQRGMRALTAFCLGLALGGGLVVVSSWGWLTGSP